MCSPLTYPNLLPETATLPEKQIDSVCIMLFDSICESDGYEVLNKAVVDSVNPEGLELDIEQV